MRGGIPKAMICAMLLSGVLFVLFLAGCWLYCLTDAALTPAAEFRGLTKEAWLFIIATTFVVGAIAWLVARGSRETLASRSRQAPDGHAHRPGPDDDPDFLRHLDRRIRGTSADPGELPRTNRDLLPSRPVSRHQPLLFPVPPVTPATAVGFVDVATTFLAVGSPDCGHHVDKVQRRIQRQPSSYPAVRGVAPRAQRNRAPVSQRTRPGCGREAALPPTGRVIAAPAERMPSITLRTK